MVMMYLATPFLALIGLFTCWPLGLIHRRYLHLHLLVPLCQVLWLYILLLLHLLQLLWTLSFNQSIKRLLLDFQRKPWLPISIWFQMNALEIVNLQAMMTFFPNNSLLDQLICRLTHTQQRYFYRLETFLFPHWSIDLVNWLFLGTLRNIALQQKKCSCLSDSLFVLSLQILNWIWQFLQACILSILHLPHIPLINCSLSLFRCRFCIFIRSHLQTSDASVSKLQLWFWFSFFINWCVQSFNFIFFNFFLFESLELLLCLHVTSSNNIHFHFCPVRFMPSAISCPHRQVLSGHFPFAIANCRHSINWLPLFHKAFAWLFIISSFPHRSIDHSTIVTNNPVGQSPFGSISKFVPSCTFHISPYFQPFCAVVQFPILSLQLQFSGWSLCIDFSWTSFGRFHQFNSHSIHFQSCVFVLELDQLICLPIGNWHSLSSSTWTSSQRQFVSEFFRKKNHWALANWPCKGQVLDSILCHRRQFRLPGRHHALLGSAG